MSEKESMSVFWHPPAHVGPLDIHESIDGGASLFQMELLGGGHHPKCHHYEWGPCTCARHEPEAEASQPTLEGDETVDDESRLQKIAQWFSERMGGFDESGSVITIGNIETSSEIKPE